MKKCLPDLKIITILLVLVLTASMVNAQKVASVSGPWNVNATWGGNTPPTAADDVIINNGINVTIPVAATCASLTINAGITVTTLTINTGFSLTVTTSGGGSGDVMINAGTDGTSARTISLAGTGTFSCVSLTMADVLPGNSASSLTVAAGIATVSNDITMNGAGAENVISLSTGTLNLGGNISATNGTLTASANSTVDYNGADQNVRAATYGNLKISGTGTKTQAGLIAVATNLTVASGVTLDVTGFNFTVTGTTSVNGTLTHSSATGTKTFTGNVTINNGGTWNDDADVIPITFSGNLQNDGTLNAGTGVHTFSAAGKTFSGTGGISIPNITISGTRTNSGTLTASTLNVNAAVTNNGTITTSTALAGSNTLTQGVNAILNIGGTSAITGLTASANPNTVNYTGSGQTVKLATYHHLNLSGSGTATAGGILDINGDITIGSGVSLDGSTFAHTIAGNWINNGGTYTSTGAGTVTFNGTTQSIGGTSPSTFNNLTINGAPSTATLAVNISVVGNLALSTGDVLDLVSFSCNRTTAGGTLSLTSSSTLKLAGSTGGQPGSNFPLDFTTYSLSGTVNYNNAAGGQTIFGTTYTTLTMGNTSGTQTAGGNIITTTINNNTNAANILDMGLFTLAASTINNTGTVKTQNTSATPLPTGEIFGGIVEYEGVAQTVRANTYNNLVLSGSGTKTVEANFVINGDVTINSGVTLAAPAGGNDDIDLNGNWINNGTFTRGDDQVMFSGTSVQSIGGTSPTTFASLRINNAQGVIMNMPATVSTNLTLTSGLLTSGTSTMLTLNDGTTISTPSNTSFVNGPVTKIGNDVFTFPVGKSGTGYQPISISAPGVVTDAFTAEYMRSSGTSLGPITAPGLLWVSNCEYWSLDRPAGSSNVNVTLNWNANSDCNGGAYVTTTTGLQVSYFDGATWSSSAVNGATGNSAAGTVTRNALATYGIVTIGNVNVGGNPLPVMFADVKAFEKNNGVQIDWSNLTERDLVKYIVERSANGVNFTAINQQLPRSNHNDKESYSAFDATPFSGANYYRIKVLEIGGKIIYSKILRVDIGSATGGFTLYPNPVKGNQVSVGISTKQGQYTMKVVNTAGQEIYSKRITHQGGSMTQTVELPSTVKPGVYSMLISGDNYQESKMFIVQ